MSDDVGRAGRLVSIARALLVSLDPSNEFTDTSK